MIYKTKFTEEDKNSFYFIEDKMFLGTDHGWNTSGNNGRGDALWRTGWAYITYGKKILKEGILSCFTDEVDKKGKKYIQAHRCYPNIGTDDVSRDQVISALCSLKINKDKKDLKRLRKGLKWRLSKKFTMTFDMWLWLMSISTPQPIAFVFSLLFTIINIFITAPMTIWNNILFKWSKIKEISQEEHYEILRSGVEVISTKDLKRPNKAMSICYPTYALHLFAWQLYCLPWNPLKWLLKLLCRPSVHKSNYLIKMLFGQKVSMNDIKKYRPMSGVRWQGKFFKNVDKNKNVCFYSACEIIEENYHFTNRLNITTEYNSLDNDMLYFLIEKNPKLVY